MNEPAEIQPQLNPATRLQIEFWRLGEDYQDQAQELGRTVDERGGESDEQFELRLRYGELGRKLTELSDVVGHLSERLLEPTPKPEKKNPRDLTDDDKRIFLLLPFGFNHQELGQILGKDEPSVRAHIKKIAWKKGYRDGFELAGLAFSFSHQQLVNELDFDETRIGTLSAEETQVFELMKQGLSKEEIAQQLSLSLLEVSVDLACIYRNLHPRAKENVLEGFIPVTDKADKAELSTQPKANAGEQKKDQETNWWGLSSQEMQVFMALPNGLTNVDLGKLLSLSAESVKSCLLGIKTKTGAQSRFEMALLAYETYRRDELTPEIQIDLDRFKKLTPTERRVLKVLAGGSTVVEICTWLEVSEQTIRSHLKRIYIKLGVKGITQAGIFAHEAQKTGLFDSENVAPDNVQTRIQNAELQKPEIGAEPQPPATTPAKVTSGSIFERAKIHSSVDMFRSNVVRALPKIDKTLINHGGRPDKTQRFVIKDSGILTDLLERGIISKEDHEAQEIDRAAVVAAMLIRSSLAKGFLDEDKAAQSMEIIRSEVEKYLQRLEDNNGPPKSR